jgi:hypothetical protein
MLSRLFRTPVTTTTNTYAAGDHPRMPITSSTRTAITFKPEEIIVSYRNGRFHRMEISGLTDGHPGFRAIRTFSREQDVPEWACMYLGEDV